MIFGFLVNMENTNIFIPPLGPFSLKNDALPLNSLFLSPSTPVHRFDASDMAVPGGYRKKMSPIILAVLRLLDTKKLDKYV